MSIRKTTRDIQIENASLEIERFLLDARKKYDLTLAEYLYIITGCLATTAKYAVRAEREEDES